MATRTTSETATVARLDERGATSRNWIVAGKGGEQTLVGDPSGDVVELFEPPGDG